MNWKEELKARSAGLSALLSRYKWLVLVIAVGLVLIVLPSGGESVAREEAARSQSETGFDLAAVEQKFGAALSQIEGAGEVSVVLSVKSGTRRLLAEDRSYAEKKEGLEEETTTVLRGRGGGVEEEISLQEIYPVFQGALIICRGARDAGLRLKLTEATAALTGLGSDKISICEKGK